MLATTGYEPGEQLTAYNSVSARRYGYSSERTLSINKVYRQTLSANVTAPNPPRTRVDPKSLWKNPSHPTPSRSSTRATTGPGHRLSSPTSTTKVSGTSSTVSRRSRFRLLLPRRRVPPAPSPPRIELRIRRLETLRWKSG